MDKESEAPARLLPGEGARPELPPVVARLQADVRVLEWTDHGDGIAIRVQIIDYNRLINTAHAAGNLVSLDARGNRWGGMDLSARIRYADATVLVSCSTSAGVFRLECK